MAKKNKLHKNRYNPRSKEFGATRPLRVKTEDWAKWETAAQIAGVTRNTFLVTVANHAADQFLQGKYPRGVPRHGLKNDPETGHFIKKEDKIEPIDAGDLQEAKDKKEITITTSSGKTVIAPISTSSDGTGVFKVTLDREVFLDLPYLDDGKPATKPFRRWYKNEQFSKDQPDNVPGWWFLGLPYEKNSQTFIDFFIISLPSGGVIYHPQVTNAPGL